MVNAGSSSLKLRLLDSDDQIIDAIDLPAPRGRADDAELERWIESLPRVDAIGHRVVHGGTRFREAVVIDDGVVAELRALSDLAPLHQPKSLEALERVSQVLRDVHAVACFDTAFHATMPPAASTYALPGELNARPELRRYGFHGLSHAYAARRAAEILGRSIEELRTVTCHLGAGASLAAVSGGASVDTTMGFTPLEGLVMATRSGNVDPGLIMWLIDQEAIDPRELADALEHKSGVLGLAGTADMGAVVTRAREGERDAALALAVYVHRLRASIAAMAAAMDGLDVLVFTGGVGENSAEVRAAAAEGLRFLGVEIDAERNRLAEPDADIGASGAAIRTLVLAAREDIEIARQVRHLVEPAR